MQPPRDRRLSRARLTLDQHRRQMRLHPPKYIDNWSLALDLKILLRSIPRVLAGRGAS
jgi:lipopolysaccharide/colanic/teichoic acid biosynthesis glycosyltransferase